MGHGRKRPRGGALARLKQEKQAKRAESSCQVHAATHSNEGVLGRLCRFGSTLASALWHPAEVTQRRPRGPRPRAPLALEDFTVHAELEAAEKVDEPTVGSLEGSAVVQASFGTTDVVARVLAELRERGPAAFGLGDHSEVRTGLRKRKRHAQLPEDWEESQNCSLSQSDPSSDPSPTASFDSTLPNGSVPPTSDLFPCDPSYTLFSDAEIAAARLASGRGHRTLLPSSHPRSGTTGPIMFRRTYKEKKEKKVVVSREWTGMLVWSGSIDLPEWLGRKEQEVLKRGRVRKTTTVQPGQVVVDLDRVEAHVLSAPSAEELALVHQARSSTHSYVANVGVDPETSGDKNRYITNAGGIHILHTSLEECPGLLRVWDYKSIFVSARAICDVHGTVIAEGFPVRLLPGDSYQARYDRVRAVWDACPYVNKDTTKKTSRDNRMIYLGVSKMPGQKGEKLRLAGEALVPPPLPEGSTQKQEKERANLAASRERSRAWSAGPVETLMNDVVMPELERTAEDWSTRVGHGRNSQLLTTMRLQERYSQRMRRVVEEAEPNDGYLVHRASPSFGFLKGTSVKFHNDKDEVLYTRGHIINFCADPTKVLEVRLGESGVRYLIPVNSTFTLHSKEQSHSTFLWNADGTPADQSERLAFVFFSRPYFAVCDL